jgi:hypothetical protein
MRRLYERLPPKKTVYRVVDRYRNARPDRVVLDTDDWVDALSIAETCNWPRDVWTRSVEGTHPSHEWGPPHPGQQPPDPRCVRCAAWDNGSYGSQGPCGYQWDDALVSVIRRELAARSRGQAFGGTAATAVEGN